MSFVVVQVVVARFSGAGREVPLAFDLPAFDLEDAGIIHTVMCDEDDGFAPIDKLAPIEALPAIAGRATLRAGANGAVAVDIARPKSRWFASRRHFTVAVGEWGRHIYNGRYKTGDRSKEQVTVSIAAVQDGDTIERGLFRTLSPAHVIDQRVKLK